MSTEISELLSVQTNHSFYTGVRIKRNGGVPPRACHQQLFLLEGLQCRMVVFTDYGFYYLNSTNHLF